MNRDVLKQVTRYFRELEKYDKLRITDAAGESQYLFDDDGNRVGVNVLFSCEVEWKKGGPE